MSGQNSITNADTTLMQMDASKKVSKPRQRGKRTAEELDEINEFGAKVELKESARRHLKSFVEDFLDSSFNPLFGSLRKVSSHRHYAHSNSRAGDRSNHGKTRLLGNLVLQAFGTPTDGL